jgi:hypothetical protein
LFWSEIEVDVVHSRGDVFTGERSIVLSVGNWVNFSAVAEYDDNGALDAY